jgi:hypothetical protein
VPSQTGGPDSYDRLANVRFTASSQRVTTVRPAST